LHFLHFFCIHLFILLNIDQPIQLLAFDASTCVKISKVKKKKRFQKSKTRIKAIGEKLGPIRQILVLSKLSVLNFS